MTDFKRSMTKLFISLQAHPEKSHEIAEMIKQTLNNSFANINCKRVFISNGNDYSPFIINVIPNMPKVNILTVNNITDYDIDIDLASFADASNYNGMDAEELVAWLYHELLANVITDETLLRYKRLIIKYYDTNNSSVMDTIKTFGKLLWIGIFSRTRKDYIPEDIVMTGSVNAILSESSMSDSWNTALAKYVCLNGGSANILTDEYIDRMDKTQLREFNTLARKYSAYIFKYNNTDYSTMIKYIISSTNSQLIKYYCEKEPEQMIVFKEKDVYNLFDDRRLLLEQADTDIDPMLSRTLSAAELQSKYDEYALNVGDVKTASDKMKLGAQIHDLIKQLSDKMMETKFDTEGLNLLREKANMLLAKLNKIDVDKTLSVVELGGI